MTVKPGDLVVKIRYGPTERHCLTGPMGLYPQGVTDIVAAVLAALNRHAAMCEQEK